jgi:hypothetical protein
VQMQKAEGRKQKAERAMQPESVCLLLCSENDSPPQREEGPGVVGGCPTAQQPPLAPPYQGGESFSWFLGARKPAGMSDCLEIVCHSERSEESCPDLLPSAHLAQSEIPRCARNDISESLHDL